MVELYNNQKFVAEIVLVYRVRFILVGQYAGETPAVVSYG